MGKVFKYIYSDNGINFVGASNGITESYGITRKLLQDQNHQRQIEAFEIALFVPTLLVRGLREAGITWLKNCLKKGKALLIFEEFYISDRSRNVFKFEAFDAQSFRSYDFDSGAFFNRKSIVKCNTAGEFDGKPTSRLKRYQPLINPRSPPIFVFSHLWDVRVQCFLKYFNTVKKNCKNSSR